MSRSFCNWYRIVGRRWCERQASLNSHNLPYPDTIHPIVVHFVIAMVAFAIVCDVIGYFTKNPRLYEVSWWNLVFATVSIFIASIFGQIEAGLAIPYAAAIDSTIARFSS